MAPHAGVPEDASVECVALASGSNGNAVWVRTADATLLFDAGHSGRELARRAATRGLALEGTTAILVSHAHGDHVAGAGVLARRLRVPLHATAATARIAAHRLGVVPHLARFREGETLRFGRTTVETVPTPHDATGSVGFVVAAEGVRVGILTDLGHVFPRLLDVVATLDGAVLESNHDPHMLASGPYPFHLQERIAGPGGHLSNGDCREVLAGVGTQRLRWLVLAHLSGECNTPALARASVADLATNGLVLDVAPRHRASVLHRL